MRISRSCSSMTARPPEPPPNTLRSSAASAPRAALHTLPPRARRPRPEFRPQSRRRAGDRRVCSPFSTTTTNGSTRTTSPATARGCLRRPRSTCTAPTRRRSAPTAAGSRARSGSRTSPASSAARPRRAPTARSSSPRAVLQSRGFCHLNATVVRRSLFNDLGGFDVLPPLRGGSRLPSPRPRRRAALIVHDPATVARHHVPERDAPRPGWPGPPHPRPAARAGQSHPDASGRRSGPMPSATRPTR